MCLLLASLLLVLISVFAQTACIENHILTDDDLPGMPVAVRLDGDCQDCSFQCLAIAECQGYNYAKPGCTTLPCPFPTGCCWLKKTASSATLINVTSKCPSSQLAASFIRPAKPSLQSSNIAKSFATNHNNSTFKNVLYIVVDDMRPNIQPYEQEFMHTPNLQAFANTALTFSRAYCNIAVCSPSRMSFLTGRYPATTKTWNFVNHFRQANCVEVVNGTYFSSPKDVYKTVYVTNGGAGQCCSLCVAEEGQCGAWSFAPTDCDISGAWLGTCGNCSLGNSKSNKLYLHNKKQDSVYPVVSGLVGTLVSRKWVSLPQHFTQAGYLTLSSGKIFHTEQGGNGPAPWDGPATGMPPFQDPPSWSPGNHSMSNVNSIGTSRPCAENACSINATLDGDVPSGTFPFCDRIIRDDAIGKLSYAIDNYKSTSQPFFMAAGFRKPHLPCRHPAPFDQFYPNVSETRLAKHQTMDQSVPPIAHHNGAIVCNPYQPLPEPRAKQLRRDYYAAISWMDYNVGKVLDTLNGHPMVANDTVVLFHADHGFSLGEHGQWEKWTNWEHGTRVPLIVKVPWLEKSQNKQTSAIVELVDIFPSLAELTNNPVPLSYGLDGASFAQLLHNPDTSLPKNTSLSVFPRCPANRNDPTQYWQGNDCNLIERTNFFSLGVTLREDEWRYTEWLHWDEKNLQPLFNEQPIGIELYTHTNDTEATFDGLWEQVNQAGESQYAPVQARLAALLRSRYRMGTL